MEVHKAIVIVEPLGEKIEVADGETVFEAAWRQGFAWPTRCHGQAHCTFCCLEVENGDANTFEPELEEQLVLDRIRRVRASNAPYRLACRLRLKGDVVVRKEGVLKITS